jgi:hypothetical protein
MYSTQGPFKPHLGSNLLFESFMKTETNLPVHLSLSLHLMIFNQIHKDLSILLDCIKDIFFQLSIIPNGTACFKKCKQCVEY